ncbi:hypothetical protein BAE44_0019256, partial [Dichanthelium oligosanthes]
GGDQRLLQAAILLFVPGILKCFAKPWALKSASINSLVGSSSHAERTAKQNEGEMDPVEEYVKQAKAFVLEQKPLLVGGSKRILRGITFAFLFLYTKIKTAGIVSPREIDKEMGQQKAIALFHKSHREAYSDIDVKITYAIFCCTALFEYVSMAPIAFSISNDDMPVMIKEQSPEMVAQYSLIGYFARNKNHSKMMITELVLQHLKVGWKETIQDAASYRRRNLFTTAYNELLSLIHI